LGNDPADIPLMGVGRHVVVAETESEALSIAQRGYVKWRESFLLLWKKHNMMPVAHAIFPERFEDAEAQGRAVAGTPDKVRDFLQKTVDDAGLNYLLCRFAFGDITGDEALASTDLFTRKVMPDLMEYKEPA
jgi:alkanesulfonate monooxygenase SsuD/methylene tetrahydromethanopterin reductase-like flavin-dependent oxidoreductase (luciferase family)